MEEGYGEIKTVFIRASRRLILKVILPAVILPIVVLALFSLTIFHFTAHQYLGFLLGILTVATPLMLLVWPTYNFIQRRLFRQLRAWYAKQRDAGNPADRYLAQELQKKLTAVSYQHGALVGVNMFLSITVAVMVWRGYGGISLATSVCYIILGFLLSLADFLISVFVSQEEMRKVLERFLAHCRGFGYSSGAGASIGRRLFSYSLVLLLLTPGIIWVASTYLASEIVMDEMEKRGNDNMSLLAYRLDALIADGASQNEIAGLVAEYSLNDNEWVSIYDAGGEKVYEVKRGGIDNAALSGLIEEKANGGGEPDSSRFEQLGSRDYLITVASLSENEGWVVVRADLPSVSSGVFGRLTPAMLVIVILAALTAAYLTLLLTRNITNPIRRLVKTCRVVGTGDLSVEVPVESLDDIGELSSSYSEMLGSLRQIGKGLLDTSGEVSEGAENIVSVSEEIMAAIEELNALVQELSGQIQQELDQIGNVESIMGGVTETVSMSQSKASLSYEISRDAEKLVLEGREHAREAVEKMSDFKDMLDESMESIVSLGESSAMIGTIVDMITRIADQTNLLALNAAIEAARVPEHGKGFAVVADEVKKLSREAAGSAQRISELVRTIQNDVETAKSLMEKGTMGMYVGIETVDRTDKSLLSISDVVGRMAGLAEAIAQVSSHEIDESERLAESLKQMKTQVENDVAAYEQIGASSDQQTQGTMELAGTAEQLSEIAHRLTEMVAHLKIE